MLWMVRSYFFLQIRSRWWHVSSWDIATVTSVAQWLQGWTSYVVIGLGICTPGKLCIATVCLTSASFHNSHQPCILYGSPANQIRLKAEFDLQYFVPCPRTCLVPLPKPNATSAAFILHNMTRTLACSVFPKHTEWKWCTSRVNIFKRHVCSYTCISCKPVWSSLATAGNAER